MAGLRITGGELKGRRIRVPSGPGLRPMMERVRLAMFSVLGHDLLDGARILDLFSGTGAIGIEALSRGAGHADFVEANRIRARAIERSLQELSIDTAGRVYRMRVSRALSTLTGPYDLVFADPPFSLDDWDGLLEEISEGRVMTKDGTLVVEHPKKVELSERYGGIVKQQDRRYGDVVLSIYSERGSG